MPTINQASWIEANVKAVESYLKREFENFSIAHVENRPVRKKLFKLHVPWFHLAEQTFCQTASERLFHEHVAAEMRLHGEQGYHWPSER
jgi:hypothetical protein